MWIHGVLVTAAAFTIGVAYSQSLFETSQIEIDEFIKSINDNANTWTARRDFIDWTSLQPRCLPGIRDPNHQSLLSQNNVNNNRIIIPGNFDSRLKWPFCGSIRTIRDQGACSGSWAFAAVEVMSDRLCILTNGSKQFVFSPEELLSCCSSCGYGCLGGYVDAPFSYWQYNGIPSGGDFGNNSTCKPLTASATGSAPVCRRSCIPGYNKTWQDDLRHAVAAYLVPNTVEQMQIEIMTYGPISTYMDVYEDFYFYAGGIYRYTGGRFAGAHAVKILGWGAENGILYWIAANSWSTAFGEGGFFRIRRGVNEARIESYVAAGIPNIYE